jgi:hypothetical protein
VIFNPEQAQKSDFSKQVHAAQRTAAMIVMVVAFSIGIYIAIGLILLGTAKRGASSDYQKHFLIAAAILAFASITFRRAQFGKVKLEYVAGRRGTQGLIRHFVQTTIIAVSVAELIGILALVIIFVGGSQFEVLLIGIVGLAIVFSCYPRFAAWQRTIQYFDSITYQD